MNNLRQTTKLKPTLRFPEFSEDWSLREISNIVDRVTDPVDVDDLTKYQEIGIRSHGKGIFYKDPVEGNELGNKRVFWIKKDTFVVNIVFAWEQAIAKTTQNEIGMIASHRFPMYQPKEKILDLDFLLYFFLRKRGKHLLELASPGGAGRNKTLGQKQFNDLKISIPSYLEQTKISAFLNHVSNLVSKQSRQIDLLHEYKNGLRQQIFNRNISFQSDKDNNNHWEKHNLSFYLKERKERNKDNKVLEVFSVAKEKGVVNQIEHLGRSYASSDLSNYKVVYPGDIVYTKSPTAGFPYGVVKQNRTKRKGLVSSLYAVYRPKDETIGYLIQEYFDSPTNTLNYLNPLVHKGAKNTINIGNKVFLNGRNISLTESKPEREKIIKTFSLIDEYVSLKKQRLQSLKSWKKGLLQQMFV